MAHFEPYYCSTLDSILPPVVQNWILCFPCDTNNVNGISDILRAGLEKTIKQRPYLAGRLGKDDKAGRLKLTYSDHEDIHNLFSVSDLTSKPDVWGLSYEELRRQEMPIRELHPQVLTPPDAYEKLATCPIVARATFIPGGCLLDVCLSHSFLDGGGGAMEVESWAENCKDLQHNIGQSMSGDLEQSQLSAVDLSPSGNVAAVKSLQYPDVLRDIAAPVGEELARIQEDVKLWELLGLQKPPTDPVAAPPPPPVKIRVSAIFVASAESIRHLKTEIAPSSTKVDEPEAIPYVSSFDAIAALVWRCILRARVPDLAEFGMINSRLRVPINVRQVLNIPQDYHGNVLLNSLTELPVEYLIAEENWTRIAPKIRSSLNFSRETGRVSDAIKLSWVLLDPASRRTLFTETTRTRHDVVLTSWQDMSYYKHDWGPMFGSPGNPEFFRLPHSWLRGICALEPRRTQDEVEILINLEPHQMDRLRSDKEFTKYFGLKSL